MQIFRRKKEIMKTKQTTSGKYESKRPCERGLGTGVKLV
jgi:hypothetical protein